MVKEGISILWQTALSVIDVGSNILYHLLGRDLCSEDIALIEKMFMYMESKNQDDIGSGFYERQTKKSEDEYSKKFIQLIKELKKGICCFFIS